MESSPVLSFEGVSEREANELAASLRQALLDADPSVVAETERTNSGHMDLGSVLSVVLAAPASMIVARAFLRWAARNNQAHVTLHTKDGVLIARNLESKDVADVARSLCATSPAK